MDDSSVSLFADKSRMTPEMLCDFLKTTLSATGNRSDLVTSWCRIYVERNPDRNYAKKLAGGPDAFLHYMYLLDIAPHNGCEHSEYIAQCKTLIAHMRAEGMQVVASGDLEEELGEHPPVA